LEKINEKYEKFEKGFLRHLKKHMKYKGEALPVFKFNFGVEENELGDKSPSPEPTPKDKEESEKAEEAQNE